MKTTTEIREQQVINKKDLNDEAALGDIDDGTNEDDLSIATQVKDVEEDENEEEKQDGNQNSRERGEIDSKNASALDALKAYKKNRVYGRVSSTSTPSDATTSTSPTIPVSISASTEDREKEEGDDKISETKTDMTSDETIQDENDEDSIATVQMDQDLFRMEDDDNENDETNSVKTESKIENNESLEVDDDEMLVLDQTQTCTQTLSQEEDEYSINISNNDGEDDSKGVSDVAETSDETPRIGRRKKKYPMGKHVKSNESKGETITIETDSKKTAVEEKQADAVEDEDEDVDTFSLTQDQDTQDVNKETEEIEQQHETEVKLSKEENDSSSAIHHEPVSLSKRELRKMVRDVYVQYPDKESMTFRQFRNALKTAKNVTLDKQQRKMVKEELANLMNQDSDSDPELEDARGEDEEHSSTESDYEEPATKTKKKNKSSKKKNRITRQEEGNEDENDSKSISPSRRTRPKKTRRTPSHLKIHHEMRRKKVLAEARIRAEEMQAAKNKKLNEEDQKRAQLIAKKFDTNTEEARVQRMEDRIGLLGRLKQKRLDLLAVRGDSNDVNDEQDENEDNKKLSFLSSMNKMDKDDIIVDDGQNDRSSSEEESSDDEDDGDVELEIIGKSTNTEMKSAINPLRKSSPTSVLDIFGLKAQSSNSKHPSTKKQNNIVAASFSNPRAALRNALRAKQFESGNMWLAK